MEGSMMSWRGWFLFVGQGGWPIAGWLAQSLSNVTGEADLHGMTAADLLVEFPSYTTKVQKGWDNQLSVTRISAERTDKPINCMRMAWIASDHFCLLRMNCIHDSSWIPYGFLMDSLCHGPHDDLMAMSWMLGTSSALHLGRGRFVGEDVPPECPTKPAWAPVSDVQRHPQKGPEDFINMIRTGSPCFEW